MVNLLKNSLAVKKGTAVFKMTNMKKVVKSKVAVKEWYRLMAKIL